MLAQGMRQTAAMMSAASDSALHLLAAAAAPATALAKSWWL